MESETVLMRESKGGRKAMEVAEDARQKEWLHPSFGKQLFTGKFASSMFYPFPVQIDADKKEGDVFLEQLTDVLEKYLNPDEVDVTHELPKILIQKLGEIKAFAMKVPKEYGGLGFSQVNYGRAIMKVASYCGSTATLLSAHQSIGVPQPLKLCGTKEQKEKYYPWFVEGKISAFALTEVEVGSDPAKMETEAVLSEDGKTYTLNGEKLWCTNGTIADVIVVMAKTAPKIVKGREKTQISAFIVDMDSAGVEIVHRCEFMGLKGLYNGVLRFTDVKVPAENLLDREGRGLAMALATLNTGRLTLPAFSVGVGKLCLKVCREWGKSRVQWGKPIGKHESGMEKIAYISSTTFALEAITWLTSHWADQGEVDIRIEAAMAKMISTEELWKITDVAMQLRGGRGYETARSLKARGEKPLPIERAMRDCRVNRILEGSTEIMQLFLAREAIDSHLNRLQTLLMPNASFAKKLSAGLKAFGFYSLWYPMQWVKSLFPSRHSELGELAKHFRFAERTSHKLARTIFHYMIRYREDLVNRQMILGRIVNIGTDLFAIAATCSYANQQGNPEAIQMADYYCAQAKRRIQQNFASLKSNDDEKQNALAESVLEEKVKWLEEGIMPLSE